ncbi:hypothetical protein NAPIS_ORF02421 [Vairimorpha apis BRL 01]|uniref:Uncharacterized protein n=1 Tax=Vairimorpha apis BRL 01 TaxID=1037528 RepID=T0MG55_9MICR|nr:hypothetical protein NAPIS_ORF02421 [Vairimorpha apis BRL 01]
MNIIIKLILVLYIIICSNLESNKINPVKIVSVLYKTNKDVSMIKNSDNDKSVVNLFNKNESSIISNRLENNSCSDLKFITLNDLSTKTNENQSNPISSINLSNPPFSIDYIDNVTLKLIASSDNPDTTKNQLKNTNLKKLILNI